ncbi:MAG: hypothetical protein AAB243_04515, partial [Planctomycetota bacterium]
SNERTKISSVTITPPGSIALREILSTLKTQPRTGLRDTKRRNGEERNRTNAVFSLLYFSFCDGSAGIK